jgi:plastocyanin
MSSRLFALIGSVALLLSAGCNLSSDDAGEAQAAATPSAPTGIIPGMKIRPGIDESCLVVASEPATEAGGTTTARAPSYQALDSVTDGGTIQGTISYNGSLTDEVVDIVSDKSVCEDPATPGKRKTDSLLAKNGKLQNAVVTLTDIKSGKGFEQQTVTLNNQGCMFEPRITLMRKGDIVAATNSDPVLHNTHLYLKRKTGNKELENIALASKGAVVKKKVKKAGLVDVKCDAHRWMQGWIVVTDHPYSALTDANGSFSLTDVPPGDYTLRVWHEKLSAKEVKVSVAAGTDVTSDVTLE